MECGSALPLSLRRGASRLPSTLPLPFRGRCRCSGALQCAIDVAARPPVFRRPPRHIPQFTPHKNRRSAAWFTLSSRQRRAAFCAPTRDLSSTFVLHDVLPARYPRPTPTAAFLKTPSPSISTSATSPAFIKTGGLRNTPTPEGVPVAIMSPGSNVIASEINEINSGTRKIIFDVFES